MSPIVSWVDVRRSISPENCYSFANFWSAPFFPLKLETELLRHTCKCRLCWYRPRFDVLSHNHWDDQIYNWPFFRPHLYHTIYPICCWVGAKLRPEIWLSSIIDVVVHVSSQLQTLRPTGLSMATFGKLPLPSSSLCPAHPPPRSGGSLSAFSKSLSHILAPCWSVASLFFSFLFKR